MGVVRAVASTGRTVVATIHQPSASIFAAFDELLLLARGGTLVYSGPAGGVVPYLSGFPGAPRLEPGRNTASWMLEAAAALSADGASLTEAYAASAAGAAAAARAAEASKPPAAGACAAPRAAPARRPGALVQFWEVLVRNVRGQWRDPGHTISRYVITVLMGFIIGTVELNKAR
jgi:hypothetical protein